MSETLKNDSYEEAPEITAAQLKKTLKQLSKNQLITLVLQQVQINIEQQTSNKIMLDELKRLEDKYMRPEAESQAPDANQETKNA